MCNIYFTILLLLFCNYPRILGEEIYCNIIGKYPLQRISENFLSLSLDPEVFLGGLNLR